MRLMTVPEVAERLACSRWTVDRAIRAGRLRAVRHGRGWRVVESDLAEFIAALPDNQEGGPRHGAG